MPQNTLPSPHATEVDDSYDLAQHGYRQRLNRSLGSFSSFAAGFSYISILTGITQLFGFGYGFGGPQLFWTWLVVLAGQFCVALVFAELGARYPIAGSVYQWSKSISSRAIAWFAGWLMLIGSLVTVAAVAIAEQIALPAIWSGFAVFSDPTKNAVLLGSCTIVVTTIINVLGVRVMSRINNVGVIAELIGAALLIVLLLVHATRGPGVVLDSEGTGPGLPGWDSLGRIAPLLLAAIMPAYVMFGFDTACSLAEETNNPRKRTPRAILQALAAAGTAGALLLLFALMATKTLDPAKISLTGFPGIIESTLGTTLGKILLADVAFAIFVCTLAIQTATIRIAFSMARDKRLPGSNRLAHVLEHRHSPLLPAILSGVLAIALLLVNIGNSKIFLVITSVAIALVYLAYLLVTAPLLVKRLRGWPADRGRNGWFFLGRGPGIFINIVAVGYGTLGLINLVWPREIVYGTGTYAWGGIIFIGGVVVIGGVYYALAQHGREHGITDEHRAAEPPAPPGAAPTMTHAKPVADGAV